MHEIDEISGVVGWPQADRGRAARAQAVEGSWCI